MATTDPAPVTREDVDGLALALPEVSNDGTPELPDYRVRGKSFVVWRGPRKDALDPDTGERLPDVIVVRVPGPDDKAAILEGGPPWFTTAHFDGYDAVLVRERDLGLVDYVELVELVTDAWATVAPRKLVKEHLG
jgi:hypothetical protein